jgi:hypothetical protein
MRIQLVNPLKNIKGICRLHPAFNALRPQVRMQGYLYIATESNFCCNVKQDGLQGFFVMPTGPFLVRDSALPLKETSLKCQTLNN